MTQPKYLTTLLFETRTRRLKNLGIGLFFQIAIEVGFTEAYLLF